jgi:hypothetical protein
MRNKIETQYLVALLAVLLMWTVVIAIFSLIPE